MNIKKIFVSSDKEDKSPKRINSVYVFNGTLFLFDKEGNQVGSPIKPRQDYGFLIEEDKQ